MESDKPLTKRTAARIAASLRDQLLDVRIGIKTPEQWTKTANEARALGVDVPRAPWEQDDDEDNTDDILDALSARGLTLSWEYPGVARIDIDETHAVNTGLHGWDYGSRVELRDGMWDEDTRPAEPEGLIEGETDPNVIADAWAIWVSEARAEG